MTIKDILIRIRNSHLISVGCEKYNMGLCNHLYLLTANELSNKLKIEALDYLRSKLPRGEFPHRHKYYSYDIHNYCWTLDKKGADERTKFINALIDEL